MSFFTCISWSESCLYFAQSMSLTYKETVEKCSRHSSRCETGSEKCEVWGSEVETEEEMYPGMTNKALTEGRHVDSMTDKAKAMTAWPQVMMMYKALAWQINQILWLTSQLVSSHGKGHIHLCCFPSNTAE